MRSNKQTDPYNCDNIYCHSRKCKTYHDEETYIKNQCEEAIKNTAK